MWPVALGGAGGRAIDLDAAPDLDDRVDGGGRPAFSALAASGGICIDLDSGAPTISGGTRTEDAATAPRRKAER